MISIEYAEELFENGEYRHCLQVLDKLSEDDHLKHEMRTHCLIELEDYKEALIRTVNAGGDTDSTGAMVGTLSGLHLGVGGIPVEWTEKLEDHQGLLECADGFWDALGK